MLKIIPGRFLDIHTLQGFDAAGQPELQIKVQGNFELDNMQANILTLQNQMFDLLSKQENEARLRAENPALQDVYDKYQLVHELVKNADSKAESTSG